MLEEFKRSCVRPSLVIAALRKEKKQAHHEDVESNGDADNKAHCIHPNSRCCRGNTSGCIKSIAGRPAGYRSKGLRTQNRISDNVISKTVLAYVQIEL